MIRRSDENAIPGIIGVKSITDGLRGNGTRKLAAVGNGNRRALSSIDENTIGDRNYVFPSGKRALIEKQEFQNEISLPHRPITRKFAAQLMNNNIQKESETRHSKDFIAKDEEIYPEDTSPPMFVRHTEALMDEIHRMDIEMVDVAMEKVMDIDICDKNNPLAVVEYVDELYTFYKKEEISSIVPPNYMDQQADINEKMRGILIDWLIEVHFKFDFMEETLFLTVNIIDRFLAVHQIARKKLQLVGITALLLACKYEEVLVPAVKDFILISDKAYIKSELLEMEKLMVNVLNFTLTVPTPYVFMKRFLKAAQSGKMLEIVSFFMIELCLVEYEMLKFPPSLLAAAAIYTAIYTLTGIREWNKTHEWYTSYTEDQLVECSRLMNWFHRNASSGKLTAVYRKFNCFKFSHAATTIEPAKFSLSFGV